MARPTPSHAAKGCGTISWAGREDDRRNKDCPAPARIYPEPILRKRHPSTDAEYNTLATSETLLCHASQALGRGVGRDSQVAPLTSFFNSLFQADGMLRQLSKPFTSPNQKSTNTVHFGTDLCGEYVMLCSSPRFVWDWTAKDRSSLSSLKSAHTSKPATPDTEWEAHQPPDRSVCGWGGGSQGPRSTGLSLEDNERKDRNLC